MGENHELHEFTRKGLHVKKVHGAQKKDSMWGERSEKKEVRSGEWALRGAVSG